MSKVNRRDFVKVSALGLGASAMPQLGVGAGEPKAQRPNILWITAEDMSPHLGCYGDSYAVTPNIDQLAREGVRYGNAFATASVCTPTRSTLITGIYASSLGTQHLRGEMPLPRSVRCYPEYLRDVGYYCSNNVKEDYNFKTPKTAWDESSNKAHWRGRKPDQPFFSIFNFMTTHQSRTRYGREQFEKVSADLSPEERRDPAKAPLPPYYPDTPTIRRNVATLYTQITLMDKQVGDILKQLEDEGLADDTIVFFYSDHGNGLPRGKRWLHDSGTRVPLIVRFPKKYRHLAPGKPGTVVDEMVSFVDFAPALLSLVGLPIPDYMQGHAFLGKAKAKPQRYVFGIRDRVDEVCEFARSVRDERYLYIRNFMPHRPRMQYGWFSEKTPLRQELRRLADAGKLEGDAAWLMAPSKPTEELYDVQSDPHQMRNLADSPKHGRILGRLRRRLRRWMIETRDMSLLPEPEILGRASGGQTPYDMARDDKAFAVERILEAAELVGKGAKQRDKLESLLSDRDSAVRYWAATGLAALGSDARPAAGALQKALGDESPSVRLAAAEALCNIGRQTEALPVIREGLVSTDSRVRIQAISITIVLGETGRPLVATLKKANSVECAPKQQELYCQWGIERALVNLGELDSPSYPEM